MVQSWNTDQLSSVEAENISEEKWELKIKNNKLRDFRVILRSLKLCSIEYDFSKVSKQGSKNDLFLLLCKLNKQKQKCVFHYSYYQTTVRSDK